MSQWFLGLAASLGAPAFSSATTRACGSSGGALDYDVGQTAVACKGGGVRLRYVRNGVLDVNATAEAAGRASQGGCVPDPSSTNQPWVYLAAQSDFVVLNRGVWVEQDDQVFVAQVNRTLRALRLRRSRAHGDAGPAAAVGSRGRAGPAERGGASAAASGAAATGRPLSPDAGPPRVVWRGTPASIPRCWRLPDPLPAPFSFNFSANPLLTSERGVSLFSWHRFAPQNVLARRLVEAAGHAYLDTYQQTAQRPGGHHPSRHDCVHWCLPGPPDEWTRLLLLLWMHGAHPSNGKVDYQLT